MASRFLSRLRACAELDAEDLRAFSAAIGMVRKVRARRDLIRDGDRPDTVLIILEGWAYRYKILPSGTRQVLAFLMPGDCCDYHVGVLREIDHSVQSITPVSIASIDGATMNALLDEHPAILRAMYIAQVIDEGTMRAWITSMGRRASIERVAHLILELYLRARNIGLTGEETMELPLSQILLADSLGMTPVHLNRVLQELKLSGAMTLQRGRLLITDPNKLVQIAGFDDNYLRRRLSPS